MCDSVDDCQPGTDPCAGYDFCLEYSNECSDVECNVTDDCPPGQTCSEDAECVDICYVDADCDDGVDCTDDVCASQVCQHNPNDSLCDNGFWCDGIEVCDPTNDCQAGTDPCAGYDFCLEYSDECSDAECNVPYDCPLGRICSCIAGQLCSEDAQCVDMNGFIQEDPDPDTSFDTPLVEDEDTGFWIRFTFGLGDLAARQAWWYFPDGFDLNDPGPPGTPVGSVCVDANEDGIDDLCHEILVLRYGR